MDKSLDRPAAPTGAAADDDPPPQPPPEIDLDACCGQGCAPCVLELIADAQERYRAELAAWQARRAARSSR